MFYVHEKQIHRIHKFLNLNFNYESIAETYKVSVSNINSIKYGQNWKNIYRIFNGQQS